MNYLAIADIHANWEALEAVLEDARGSYDRIVCLGDLVGYGPDPNRVVEWAGAKVSAAVRGNHDRACADLTGLEDFSDLARDSAFWTNRTLTQKNADYLRALPQGPIEYEGFGMAHGSPRDEDDYLVNENEAAEAFGYVRHRVTFFAHTHLQGGFKVRRGRISRFRAVSTPAELEFDTDAEYLINPGSVGQPRDRSPLAGYAIFHSNEGCLTYKRVEYDVAVTQKKIKAAGLHSLLADRLAIGQ